MLLGGHTIGPFEAEPPVADRLKLYSVAKNRSMNDIVIAAVTAYIDADTDVEEVQSIDAQVRRRYGGTLPPPRVSKRDLRAETTISVSCEDQWDPGYRAEQGLPPLGGHLGLEDKAQDESK